jgi:hypothetical protein
MISVQDDLKQSYETISIKGISRRRASQPNGGPGMWQDSGGNPVIGMEIFTPHEGQLAVLFDHVDRDRWDGSKLTKKRKSETENGKMEKWN